MDPNTSHPISQETSHLWENCFWAFSSTMPLISGRDYFLPFCYFLSPIHYLLLLWPSTPSQFSVLFTLSCILFSGFLSLAEGQEQVGPLALHSTNMTYQDPCVCSVCYLSVTLLKNIYFIQLMSISCKMNLCKD